MKKTLLITFLLFCSIVSCTNRDGEIIDLINSVKKQNDDLKAQITALKKTTDSAIVAVLKVNSLQVTTDKKIDLIQTDLKSLLTQIGTLTSQMTTANVDLGILKTKIDALQVKCAELVAQIAALNYNLTSGNPTKIDNLSWTLVSNGNSWRVIPNVDSSVLFLSRAYDVLKSTNFGMSFSATGASFPIVRSELGTREGGAFSNFNGGQLVIAGMDKGFYMSNNAVSFASVGPMGFGCGSESILALKDGRFIASMGGYQRGIYKSSGSDNQTWTNKWGGIQLDPRDFSQKNNVIFSATTGGILKSTDQGESWSNELSIDALDVETVNDSLFFVGNNNFNFYVSKTSSINTDNVRYKFNSYIYDCVYSDIYKVFVAVSINSGIYVSNNRGMSWKQYTIPGVTQYNKLTIIKNKIFIATTSGLYATTL
jgi:hypothetical protein